MARNRARLLLALALAIFFLLQFWSELFFGIGKGNPESRLKYLALSQKVFPLAGRSFREAAFIELQRGARTSDAKIISRSIADFRSAIRRNPLDYYAHYYLAKALLQVGTQNPEHFEEAVIELKRAATIRRSNKPIALDCTRVFLSLWSLLTDADKKHASDLLADLMPALSWNEFSSILDMWSLYVQDTPLLMSWLNQKPSFFGQTANQLLNAEIPLATRWELIGLYETYAFSSTEQRFRELTFRGEIETKELRRLLRPLQAIQGYFRLSKESEFPVDKWNSMRRSLRLSLISRLLGDPLLEKDPQLQAELEAAVSAQVNDVSSITDLGDLQKLLQEENFFRANDFRSLYWKTLINLRLGNYNDVVQEVENLRLGLSFVNQEQVNVYTDIMLILTDAYFNNKLLTAAEGIAQELYGQQPENPEVLFRLWEIESILGQDEIRDKVLEQRLQTLTENRKVVVDRERFEKTVYLFDDRTVEIAFSDGLKLNFPHYQLLQVFLDGRIVHEAYVKDLRPEAGPLIVTADADQERVRLAVILR